LFKIDIEVI